MIKGSDTIILHENEKFPKMVSSLGFRLSLLMLRQELDHFHGDRRLNFSVYNLNACLN